MSKLATGNTDVFKLTLSRRLIRAGCALLDQGNYEPDWF